MRLLILCLLLSTVTAQQCSCEADLQREKIGRATWFLIHEIVENVPYSQEAEFYFKQFITGLRHIYPCGICRKHIEEMDIKNVSMSKTWACNFHNRINKQLGKPIVQC